MLPPIGFSLEYGANTGARAFTDILADQPDFAYSPFTESKIGWLFVLDRESQTPTRFFARELRFELDELGEPNDQPSLAARAFGHPPLPGPPEEGEGQGPSGPGAVTDTGIEIGNTGVFAELSERLPIAFQSGSNTFDIEEQTDPHQLKAGKAENLQRGRGGNRTSVRAIWVGKNDRLVRIQMDSTGSRSLLGRIRDLAAAQGFMNLRDTSGQAWPAIGYAVESKGALEVDIRVTAQGGRFSASQLPNINRNQTLYVYFQVPVGRTVDTYIAGSDVQKFSEPLEIIQANRR